MDGVRILDVEMTGDRKYDWVSGTNEYLNDGLASGLKQMFNDGDIKLTPYEEHSIVVVTYMIARWGKSTAMGNQEIGIDVKMLFNHEPLKYSVNVKLANGDDTLYELTNESMGNIKEVILPLFDRIVLEIGKKSKIRSLINKL